MARQAAWHSDVDWSMRPGFAVGIFHIEGRKLKNRLLPVLNQSIIEMEELLLESFHSKCEVCLAACRISFAHDRAIRKRCVNTHSASERLTEILILSVILLTTSPASRSDMPSLFV
jgi:hypothetical protein